MRKSLLDNSINSAGYLWQGFKMLGHPKLRHFVLIPLLINILIFTILLIFSIHWFGDLVNWIDSFLPSWLLWLNWLLWMFFAVAIWLTLIYTFSIIANLIASPFNSLLAEKTELLLSGKTADIESGFAFIIKDLPRVLNHERQKIFYYIPRAILCLILFFIPVIQIAAPVIWFLFNAWMMSIQYIDYPMDNHRISFYDIRKQLASKRLSSLGFGSTVMFASMLPIVNFLVMPAAVVGATIFWIEKLNIKKL